MSVVGRVGLYETALKNAIHIGYVVDSSSLIVHVDIVVKEEETSWPSPPEMVSWADV